MLREPSFLNQGCVAFPRTPCVRPARTRMIAMNTARKPHKIFRIRELGLHQTAERHHRKSPISRFPRGERAPRRRLEESTPDSWLTRPAQPTRCRADTDADGEETGRFPAFPRTTWSQSRRVRALGSVRLGQIRHSENTVYTEILRDCSDRRKKSSQPAEHALRGAHHGPGTPVLRSTAFPWFRQ